MPSFGYLIIAEDGKTDGRADGKRQTYIPPPLAGDIKRIQHVLIKVKETVSPRFIVGNYIFFGENNRFYIAAICKVFWL